MPRPMFGDVLSYLRKVCAAQTARDLGDGELLARFLANRDDAAFAVLVQRHGPMVFNVCERVLNDSHAAEDAFQATFMVLVRRAAAVKKGKPLASWLHGVARRIALKARGQILTRRHKERQLNVMPRPEPLDDASWQELRCILDEEIGRLPEKYRAALVLCYLEGQTYDKAARELGVPKSSLATRLDRARELLRGQLVRRGITLTAGMVAAALGEKALAKPVSALLTIKTAKAAMSIAAGKAVAAGYLSARALVWAEEAMMELGGIKTKLILIVLAAGLAGGGAGLGGYGALTQTAKSAAPDKLKAVQTKTDQTDAAKFGIEPVTDLFGDPLPQRALARLGTERFRYGVRTRMVAYSPDGKILATAHDVPFGVCLWDAATGRLLRRLITAPDLADAIAFSPESKLLFTNNFKLIDVATGKLVREFSDIPFPQAIGIAYSPDGKTVAAGNRHGGTPQIEIWDVASGKTLHRLKWEGDYASKIAFSPDGVMLASAGKTVRLWNTATGMEIRRIEGNAIGTWSIAFAPQGKILATAGIEGVRIWDLESGKEPHRLGSEPRDRQIINTIFLSFSTDGKLLASAGDDGIVSLWDSASWSLLRSWRVTSARTESIAFSPDGKTLASVGYFDHAVRRWDTSTGKEIDGMGGHNSVVESLVFRNGGKALLSWGCDKRIVEWDLATSRQLRQVLAEPQDAGWQGTVLDVTSDGKIAALRNLPVADSVVHLIETGQGKEISELKGHYRFSDAKFSPNGRFLATGAEDGIQVWNVAGAKELYHIPVAQPRMTVIGLKFARMWMLAFSPNNKLLAWTAADNTIRLCEAESGKELRRWESEQITPGILAFSPDGKSLVSVAPDLNSMNNPIGSSVHVWEASTGKQIGRFVWHDQTAIDSVAFSPNGFVLAMGSNFATTRYGVERRSMIRMWDLLINQEIGQIDTPQSLVTALSFAPDGRTLASGGGDSTILIWDVTGHAGKPKPAALTPVQLDDLWLDLISDASVVDRAIWSFAFAPRQSLTFLKERLQPVAPAPAEQVAKLIADLDDERFAIRQKAVQALVVLQETAEQAIRKALAANPALEVRQRLQQILEKGNKEVIRKLRAIESLEHIGTADARQILRALAERNANPRISEAAVAALRRLGEQAGR
jgi:RNA polymerase sigma factor (sigma-70 family)